MDQYSDDPADLFTQLYDELDESAIRDGTADAWFDNERLEDVAAYVEEQAVREGLLDPATVAEQLDIADDRNERLFAYLLGLDRALMLAHPAIDVEDREGMLAVSVRLRRTGRFNTSDVDGALLPRQGVPPRLQLADERTGIETKADQFASVVRVPPAAWASTDHVVIPRISDLPAPLLRSGVHVGCAPLVKDPDDLSWEIRETGGRRLYRIAPRADVAWRERIEIVLRRLDEQGAVIGVMPELTLDDRLLELWRELVVALAPPVDSRLTWIMVGTGPVGGEDPPPNRGVLLCRRTGQVLTTQDKCHPFLLNAQQLVDWGLESRLGAEACNEDIARGDRIMIAESAAGRFAMLICEDLARTIELGQPLLAHGISHVLAPVFSKPTIQHYWEHSAAKTWAQAVGAQAIVSNSLVVASTSGAELPVGTCLAHGPEGFEGDSASEPDDLKLMRLTSRIGIRAVRPERES